MRLNTLSLIPSFLEIILNDLKTLSILNSSKLLAALLEVPVFSTISPAIDVVTITKSNAFHPSLRYDYGPFRRKPRTIIFIISSVMKITVII